MAPWRWHRAHPHTRGCQWKTSNHRCASFLSNVGVYFMQPDSHFLSGARNGSHQQRAGPDQSAAARRHPKIQIRNETLQLPQGQTHLKMRQSPVPALAPPAGAAVPGFVPGEGTPVFTGRTTARCPWQQRDPQGIGGSGSLFWHRRSERERLQQSPVNWKPCSVTCQISNKSISSLSAAVSLLRVEKAEVFV